MWINKDHKENREYTEQELIKLLFGSRSEREIAFTYIYNKFANRVYSYCIRISDSRQDADDIFQETFTNFINSIVDEKEIKNIGSYLITIARNIHLNQQRTKKKYNLNIEDYNHFLLVDEKDKYEKKEEMELINKALELLDFPYREIFILRQYHNLEYEEISKIVNEKVNVLRNRYFRAKEKLREILDPIINEKIN